MTALKVLALSLGGLVVYNLLTKSLALGSIRFLSVRIVGIDFDGATPILKMVVPAQNTSNQKFNVKSVSGDLYVIKDNKNIFVGNVSNFSQQSVLPNAQSDVAFDVRLSLIGVVSDLIKSLQWGNFESTIKLDALVNVDNYQVPVVTTMTIP